MKNNGKFQVIFIYVILLIVGTCFSSIILSKSLNDNIKPIEGFINGQILFPPLYGATTYLIDHTGAINHTWSSSYTPGAAAYFLGDGTILRTIQTVISGGGSGGGVQKVLWDGTVVWDFRYDSNGKLSHHDIECLPNGNVLMIAWELKTRNEAIAAGRNPGYISDKGFKPDHVIEVKPMGPNSGEIVWEWHVWDHLIQDYDPSKANYGVVGDHPELIDINFGIFNYDWLHMNSIDYNPKFDQILLSIHNLNEIWVIDHSTTTEEAAGHSGGNSGKGGDILYRWGNPQAYDAGTAKDEKLFSQHGTSWIKPGCPGAGNILLFNNGNFRPGGEYSSVDEFAPPVDSNGDYYLEPGSAYGPEDVTWSYTASPPESFFSYYCGDTKRLKNGNTLICDGAAGKFFEVSPENNIVWQYVNSYPKPSLNDVFNIDYIPPEEPPQPNNPDLDCSGSLLRVNINPGDMVVGSFKVQNIGDSLSLLNWTFNISSIDWGTWSFKPLSGENLTPEDGQVNVQVSVITPNETDSDFHGYVRVENINNLSDFGLIQVHLKTPKNKEVFHKQMYRFMLRFKNLYLENIYNLFKSFYHFLMP